MLLSVEDLTRLVFLQLTPLQFLQYFEHGMPDFLHLQRALEQSVVHPQET